MRIDMKLLAPCIAPRPVRIHHAEHGGIISVCFNSSLLKYGGDIAVGAMTILTSVMQFAMLPLQGLAQGAQPISSSKPRRENAARVRQTFFVLLKASLVFRSSSGAASCSSLRRSRGFSRRTPSCWLAFTPRRCASIGGALFILGIQIACQMTFVSIGNAPCSPIIVAILQVRAADFADLHSCRTSCPTERWPSILPSLSPIRSP